MIIITAGANTYTSIYDKIVVLVTTGHVLAHRDNIGIILYDQGSSFGGTLDVGES